MFISDNSTYFVGSIMASNPPAAPDPTPAPVRYLALGNGNVK